VRPRQEIAATAKFEHAESSLIIQCPQHAERSQPPDSFARGSSVSYLYEFNGTLFNLKLRCAETERRKTMSQFEAASNATYIANIVSIGAFLASIVSGFAVALVANKRP
jgi:hypothetical protein